jgi:hypothetical protein
MRADAGRPRERIRDSAVILVRTHSLRTLDAIQLACALVARGETAAAEDFTFVSADAEQNAAALRENLIVLNPAQIA